MEAKSWPYVHRMLKVLKVPGAIVENAAWHSLFAAVQNVLIFCFECLLSTAECSL